jgi:hypothetical protein
MRGGSLGWLRSGAIAVLAVGVLSGRALAAAGLSENATPKCDRACLEGFLNQYLAALVARDPSRVPFAANVKFTENTARLKIGEGFWGTASGQGAFKLYFAEPETGQVGFIGVMKEWDNPVILCLRLRVSDEKIAEVEDFVVRDAGAGKNLDAIGKPNPLFLEPIPPAERETREELVKTANMYFSGLENNDGKGDYPFAPGCNRIENGTQTTNNPDIYKGQPPGNGYPIMSLGCEAQFKTGFFRIVTNIRDRRFVIVDRERGLVFAFGFFDHAGTVKTVTLIDGTTFPSTLRHPLTFEIGEVFKIEKGKIYAIQAALTQEPYGIKSGWGSETPHPAATPTKSPETTADCDRKCLNRLVDAYRAALVEHDPFRLPLAKDARYTENAQDLKLGDGLWGTFTGWGSYKLYIDDPEQGEVGFVGVTDEAGMAGLLCVRLRVVDRKITEIEALITRRETATGFTRPDGFSDPKVAPAIAGFFEDVPESERESRQDLISQTDLYFEGIEKSSGSIVPFAPNLIRVENGTQTCPSSFGPTASKNGAPTGCAAQLDTHIFEYIYPIRPRRYTVVDRQRGIVMGTFMFNTSGKVKSVDVPGVGKVDETPAALRPFSEEVDEIFKIRDGKIDSVIAVMAGLPYGATSGWQ